MTETATLLIDEVLPSRPMRQWDLHAAGTGLELAETFRYRYNIEPVLLIVATVAVTDLVRRLRARWQRQQRSL